MGGKKGSKAPAPDPAIGEAAKMQAQIAGQWLDFSKEQFAISNERQKGIDELSKRITESQLGAQEKANAWADEDRNRYKTIFQPLEDKYVEDAKNWDSAERQGQMAAEAKADVMSNAAAAQQQNERQMSSMGVDPRSGRFAGVDRGTDLNTALASAGAQNNARNTVRQQGMSMRADAANMGKGLPSQAAGAAGLGLTAGSSAMNSTLGANNSWMQGNSIMTSGYGGAMQGYGSQANILNQRYGNQLSAWAQQNSANSQAQSGLFSGLGSMAGMAMMAYSSKDFKEDKHEIDGALDAVNAMPVEEWQYKEGIADGGRHIGPYAEDFKAATGKGNGKMIPVMDAVGVTMKAVQELDKKVEKLASVAGKSIKRPAQRASA